MNVPQRSIPKINGQGSPLELDTFAILGSVDLMDLEEVISYVLHNGVAIVRSGVTSPSASILQSFKRRPPLVPVVRLTQGGLQSFDRTSITGACPHGLFSLFFGAGPGPEHPNTDVLPVLLTAAAGGVR